MSSAENLSNYQKNLCEYGGLFGVLLALTCLVQHFIAAIPSPVTNPMIPVYFLAITAFILLGLLKTEAIYFLIASAALVMLVEWQFIRYYAFSLVVLLLFIYHIVFIGILYSEGIPAKLKQAKKQKQEEEAEWRGRI